jgi:hypothetical protein
MIITSYDGCGEAPGGGINTTGRRLDFSRLRRFRFIAPHVIDSTSSKGQSAESSSWGAGVPKANRRVIDLKSQLTCAWLFPYYQSKPSSALRQTPANRGEIPSAARRCSPKRERASTGLPVVARASLPYIQRALLKA